MAELRNINWKTFSNSLLKPEYLSALKKSRSLQWWLTLALRDSNYLLLDSQDCKDLILEYKGIKFRPDVDNYPRILEAYDRYPSLGNLRSTDTVLDLGANIGSYSLPAAKVAQKVYAVEPIFYKELEGNVELNSFENVEVLPYAIGSKSVDAGLTGLKTVQVLDLFQWWVMAGRPQIDVVRMDIGGAEWSRRPTEHILDSARLYEIEFHFYENSQRVKSDWLSWKEDLILMNFNFIARWSKHRHWLYLSAWKRDTNEYIGREVQLIDGSFQGENLKLWKGEI
jgi:hypothetical protein